MSAALPCGDAVADQADEALAQRRLADAIRQYDAAEPEVRDPDRCAGGRWMAQMLRGDLEGAWRESDAIRRRGRPDPHRFWNGEPVEGRRVIVRCLHGFGDAVQMLRFLPALGRRAASVVVEVPPRLLPMAPCFDGMTRAITWGEGAPAAPPAWDTQVEIMELPYLLRVSEGELAPTQGYLRLPAAELARVRERMGATPQARVGVVWCAGEWNPSRSLPLEALRTLLATEGVEFWSLQGEPERSRCRLEALPRPPRDGAELGDGLLALAAAIAQMDLVICVDTLAAHLAGVLGVPCWLLLQAQADWRWQTGRSDSPWYPSLRLMRQTEDQGWAGLLEQVEEELQGWLKGRHLRR